MHTKIKVNIQKETKEVKFYSLYLKKKIFNSFKFSYQLFRNDES